MSRNDQPITLAHGEGARATRSLIRDHVLRYLGNPTLNQLDDAAAISANSTQLRFTTDSYVVSPLAFPGGDIGSMAVYGTANDLAVSGAIPKWISVALIIEEGFLLSTLDGILQRIAAAAQNCDVAVVCGDTKVVPRGAVDGLFINTAGLGELIEPALPGPSGIRADDSIVVSGPIGQHGIAVLAARDDLGFEPAPRSDSAPLQDAVATLMDDHNDAVRCMRDATRGGVSAVLHEWSDACKFTFALDEQSIPVSGEVRGACELLGLDPLYIANEGTMVLVVDSNRVDDVLSALQTVPVSSQSAVIGNVTDRKIAPVTIQRMLGGEQPVDEPTGALLPRIC